ncbi:hypothetical protein GCM10022243_67640 [Saccharothrix violaceirubra]|uniref:5-methylcytosine-specific restriction endonuclease McrBC regulatory subunit McrC n=1 Tax=Saccharothrix violaceirubra TaxID=413306 RepID=A0A7W7T2F8_9PSEU|nr:hypothetical protein [Saccharothrix violaceirubra]MBB4965286.1 5-methylcytosine-specific restriction endonuclease McrBC regulatory subunit McrC [Saccharothrix violaceirubra]
MLATDDTGAVLDAEFEIEQDGDSSVCEDFVTVALTEAWRSRPGRTRPKPPTLLDAERGIAMAPDVVHLVDEIPRIVVDAKYKLATGTGRYPNADHYQALAYATALEVAHTWLVYAGTAELARTHHVLNSPVTITTYALDLDVEPPELLAQVQRLADSAWDAQP